MKPTAFAFALAAASGHEHPNHADVAHRSALEEFHARDVMRADAPVKSDLSRDLCRLGCFYHGPAFGDGVTGGLLHKDMGTCFAGCDEWEGVPMVRGGDDYDLGLLFGQ